MISIADGSVRIQTSAEAQAATPSWLLGLLVTAAQRQSVATFRAFILGENRRALRVVGALFTSVHPQWYGRECLIQAPVATFRPESH